jgi:hypothetical protein
MKSVRLAVLSGCALVFAAGSAMAAEPPANLRFYWVMEEGADLTLDGAPLGHADPKSVGFFAVPAGKHVLAATTAKGEKAVLNADFAPAQQAQSRGRSWWCVAGGRKDGDPNLTLLQMQQASCQKMADVAPQDDVPPGH